MDPLTHVSAYLERLPHGTASYPDCAVRASIYERTRERLPPIDRRRVSEAMSPAFAAYLHSGPADDWIPEVWACSLLELWFATACAGDEARCRQGLRTHNQEVFEASLLRAATRVLSASLVLMGMARTWNLTRRGPTAARAVMGPRDERPRQARVEIEHPPWIYSRCQLWGFEEAFRALADQLRLERFELDDATPSSQKTTLCFRWHED